MYYDHLVYFTATGNMLWPFRIFCCNLVYFPRFGILDQKNLATLILSRGREGFEMRSVTKMEQEIGRESEILFQISE
jgi:hypothetical protein